MKKMEQDTTQWEDEAKVEENKQQIMRQLSSRQLSLKDLAKRKMEVNKESDFEKPKLSSRNKNLLEKDEIQNTEGFFFQNWLYKDMTVKIENYDMWKKHNINLPPEHDESAVLEFEASDIGQQQFRTVNELRAIIKYIQKLMSQGRFVDNLEENLIRFDLFIQGFEPIHGVPIELAGKRSYELRFKGESEKAAKGRSFKP